MNINRAARAQQGAVLVVALIMLLLLTIIGISSMRSTTLQERMAGNLRDESHALQAAEAAMRQGEAVVKGQSVSHWQDYVSSSSWDDASDISGLTTPKYRLTTLPGVTVGFVVIVAVCPFRDARRMNVDHVPALATLHP